MALLVVAVLGTGASVRSSAAQQGKMLDPATVAEVTTPITVKNGSYVLWAGSYDFAPGAGIPTHFHGGPVLVTVVSGELTLIDKSGTRTVKAGQTFTEQPGYVHSVINRGTTVARIVDAELIPKGAEETTLVK